MAVETNARIEFSVASVEEWEKVNPKLHQGEPVFAKKPSGKYILKVGAPGGSTYKNAVVVWDQDDAETKMTSTQDAAAQALASKNAASASASAAKASENAAAASKSAAAKSEANAKTSETNAAASNASAAISASTASAKATASANSASAAATSEKNAAGSASAAKTSESNAMKSASAANTSAGNAKGSENNASASATNAANSAADAAQSAENAKTWDPTYYLKGFKSMGEHPETNPQIINIPTTAGMFGINGFPDGFTKDDNMYPYAIVTNFQGESGTLLSFYTTHARPTLYFRTGWPDERGWHSWKEIATTADVYTKKEVDNAIANKKGLPANFSDVDGNICAYAPDANTDSAFVGYVADNGGRLGTAGSNINIKSWNGIGFINANKGDPSTANKVTVGIDVRRGILNAHKVVATESITAPNIYTKTEVDDKIPTKTSQLTNDSGFAVISNGHLVINGSELWIE